jgi:biopolymer transport protein ExbD
MPLKTQQDEQSTLNLTPMIDIVFLLIIFFMVGTKFTEPEYHIKVNPAQVSDVSSLAPAPEKRVINVGKDGRIALDQVEVTEEELKAKLVAARSQYQELGVTVRADGETFHQNVAQVLTACKQAGIENMSLSVKKVR